MCQWPVRVRMRRRRRVKVNGAAVVGGNGQERCHCLPIRASAGASAGAAVLGTLTGQVRIGTSFRCAFPISISTKSNEIINDMTFAVLRTRYCPPYCPALCLRFALTLCPHSMPTRHLHTSLTYHFPRTMSRAEGFMTLQPRDN